MTGDRMTGDRFVSYFSYRGSSNGARFGVSYLDILYFCFLEYHNVILSFSILSGGRLLSFILIKVLRGKFCFVSRIKQDQLFYEFMRFIRLAKSYLQFSRSL